MQKGGETMLVLYWYQSHGRVIASEYRGKIYMVLDAMRINRTDAALVRVIVPVANTGSASEQQAERAARISSEQSFRCSVSTCRLEVERAPSSGPRRSVRNLHRSRVFLLRRAPRVS